MDANARLAELRDLLSARPAGLVWHRICALLDTWPDLDDLELGLDYAAEHLASWPDRLRVAPTHWWHQVAYGDRPQPRLRLTRALHAVSVIELDEPLRALAATPHLAQLTILTLDHCELLDPATLAELLAEPNMAALETLSVTGVDLGWEHLSLWQEIEIVPELRALTLSHDNLEDDAIEALCEVDALATLESLDLSHNLIGTFGAEVLGACTFLRGLGRLDLRGNPLDEDAIDLLLYGDAVFEEGVVLVDIED